MKSKREDQGSRVKYRKEDKKGNWDEEDLG